MQPNTIRMLAWLLALLCAWLPATPTLAAEPPVSGWSIRLQSAREEIQSASSQVDTLRRDVAWVLTRLMGSLIGIQEARKQEKEAFDQVKRFMARPDVLLEAAGKLEDARLRAEKDLEMAYGRFAHMTRLRAELESVRDRLREARAEDPPRFDEYPGYLEVQGQVRTALEKWGELWKEYQKMVSTTEDLRDGIAVGRQAEPRDFTRIQLVLLNAVPLRQSQAVDQRRPLEQATVLTVQLGDLIQAVQDALDGDLAPWDVFKLRPGEALADAGTVAELLEQRITLNQVAFKRTAEKAATLHLATDAMVRLLAEAEQAVREQVERDETARRRLQELAGQLRDKLAELRRKVENVEPGPEPPDTAPNGLQEYFARSGDAISRLHTFVATEADLTAPALTELRGLAQAVTALESDVQTARSRTSELQRLLDGGDVPPEFEGELKAEAQREVQRLHALAGRILEARERLRRQMELTSGTLQIARDMLVDVQRVAEALLEEAQRLLLLTTDAATTTRLRSDVEDLAGLVQEAQDASARVAEGMANLADLEQRLAQVRLDYSDNRDLVKELFRDLITTLPQELPPCCGGFQRADVAPRDLIFVETERPTECCVDPAEPDRVGSLTGFPNEVILPGAGSLKATGVGAYDFWSAVLGGLVPPPAAGGGGGTGCGSLFTDVAVSHQACKAIAQVALRGVVSGYPDGSFRPDQPLTRAEAAKLLVVATGRSPSPARLNLFSDTAGHWAAGYLQTAHDLGLIKGYGDGTFRPNHLVSRAEIMKLAAAAAGLSPISGLRYGDMVPTDWFAGWATVAVQYRLTGAGAAFPLWSGPNLIADRAVTRGEAAMLIANLMGIR